ncbi:MAG: PIN domain-containing protein [Cyanobacteriota bacterium]
MGTLTIPSSSLVYADTQIFIYSVEKHPIYWSILRPLWLQSRTGDIEIVSSELTLLETLVAPIKNADSLLVNAYETLLSSTEVRLIPLTKAILRDAAHLRANTNLRTPDALHAATALATSCSIFLTNDSGFRRVAGLPVVLLSDIAAT